MKLPRLFLHREIASSEEIVFDGQSARYLGQVLRLKPGDLVQAFNCSHEYTVRLLECSRRRVGGGLWSRNVGLSAPGVILSWRFHVCGRTPWNRFSVMGLNSA